MCDRKIRSCRSIPPEHMKPEIKSAVRAFTRRDFIHQSSAGIGIGWLAVSLPVILSTANLACKAESQGDIFLVLSDAEASLTDALASMIIPTDETAGAHEAGVVYFVDRSLDSFASPFKALIRSGLSDVESSIQAIRAGAVFEQLTESEKESIMGTVENTEFFKQFYFLTMAGMLSHPNHGGNRDKIGWKMIGFDDRHAWQYPFGYYDAAQNTEEA